MKISWTVTGITLFIILSAYLKAQNFCYACMPVERVFTLKETLCENEYQLIFEDEFEGQGLDLETWFPNTGDPPPFTDFNRDANSNSFFEEENIKISDGILRLQTKNKKKKTPLYDDGHGNLIDRTLFYSSAMIKSNTVSSNEWESGCFRYGKFCMRAKIPKIEAGFKPAFWFFGWAGESDVFEFLNKNSCEFNSNMHFQGNFWQCDLTEYFDYGGNLTPPKDDCTFLDDLPYQYDHKRLGDLSTEFHEYCFEWTPLKVSWYLDGRLIREHHKYYFDVGLSNDQSPPITCGFDSYGESVNVNYSLFFPRAPFSMNLILSMDGWKKWKTGDYEEGELQGELQIDYVKVWQKKPIKYVIQGNGRFLCNEDDELAFSIDINGSDEEIIGWDVSSNIELVEVMHPSPFLSSVKIRKKINFNTGPGWIKAKLSNKFACTGSTVKKDIWVGANFDVNVSVSGGECTAIRNLELTEESIGIEGFRIADARFSSTLQNDNYLIDSAESGKYIVSYFQPNLEAVIYYEFDIEGPCGFQETVIGAIHFKSRMGSECDIEKKVLLYPNPADTRVKVSFLGFEDCYFLLQEKETAKIEVFNAQGELVYNEMPMGLVHEISVGQLAKGIYYIKSTICDSSYISKFVIDR